MSDSSQARVTIAQIASAAQLIGLEFTESECELIVTSLEGQTLPYYSQLRTASLENAVSPALRFSPNMPIRTVSNTPRNQMQGLSAQQTVTRPDQLEELAFAPLLHLAHLLHTRQINSLELTQMHLARLKRYNPVLQCVVTLTEELALAQAQRADNEIASGDYRGPLHGVPWGAKDLLAVHGYPTTWGAAPYQTQSFDEDATVVQRLADAGAVLVAKLTTGALAYGDHWFGGQTKNPWDLTQGSSGSSAGPGSATAAGLVGFAIGTETMGSIISPCQRCGLTGLRPTFGRVSRHGCMTLSWSMDKIGPMCRTVEDCAVVFNAIYGSDGKDHDVVDAPFTWPHDLVLRSLRIGYVQSAFEADYENRAHDQQTLAILRDLGAELIPIELPDYTYDAFWIILWAEAAAAFDELTRNNRDDLLTHQGQNDWPNIFRKARLIPAIEYIQANRLRTQLIHAMAGVMREVDVYLQPYTWGKELALTNYTGHPAAIVPNGFSPAGKPASSMVFIGQLNKEDILLAVAKAYQDATDFHLRHPAIKG